VKQINLKQKDAKRNLEEAKRSEKICFFFSLRSETKNLKRNEAKTSEKIGPLFSLEHAKTKRNESRFASFRFQAKKNFKRNRRTLYTNDSFKNNFITEQKKMLSMSAGLIGGVPHIQ
jgi:hypothetical protein